jgi:RNA-directed DNA polymerase
MLTALGNGVKGGKWFSLIDKVFSMETLMIAWKKVRANKGAAGIDKVSITLFECNVDTYLKEIKDELREERFQPKPVKRVYIPKGDGKMRPLGIPSVKDRVVQMAIKLVIEPIFENEFLPTSFGFRPGKGAKDALREVDQLLRKGYTHVVDVDFQGYFDTIPHDKLMELVEWKVSDGRLLRLIKSFLSQEIMDENTKWTPFKGSPQGAVLSPLLANLYLHPLDLLMNSKGFEMRRYADDFVILCKSAEEAQRALTLVQQWSELAELITHPEKTHVTDCSIKGEGFDFLGYRFTGGYTFIRKKSMKAFMDKVREKTRRTSGQSLAKTISELNPMIKGWFNYFMHAHYTFFRQLDGFIRRRLRAILRKMEKSPGQGHNHEDHKKWPNAFFAKAGLFTMEKARALLLASQSR